MIWTLIGKAGAALVRTLDKAATATWAELDNCVPREMAAQSTLIAPWTDSHRHTKMIENALMERGFDRTGYAGSIWVGPNGGPDISIWIKIEDEDSIHVSYKLEEPPFMTLDFQGFCEIILTKSSFSNWRI